MPNLIWFEWEKCPDGYTVETLRSEYLQISKRGPNTLAHATASAPMWVRSMLREFNHHYRHGDEGWMVEDEYLIPRSDRVLKFQPLEGNAAAFMEFADCCNSMSNTVDFVTKYGLLERAPATYRWWLPIRYVERIQDIADTMRDVVQGWEESKKTNDFEKLIPLFNWLTDPEDRLGDDYSENDPSPASVSVRLRHRADRAGPPLLSMVPDDLGAALWLQFGQAVSANSQLRRCAVCPTWFSFGTGTGRRKSAHYCSDRCRKAANRRSKEATK